MLNNATVPLEIYSTVLFNVVVIDVYGLLTKIYSKLLAGLRMQYKIITRMYQLVFLNQSFQMKQFLRDLHSKPCPQR